MRILIVTDAWFPQVNGVVRTLNAVDGALRLKQHDVRFLTPEGRRQFSLPTYPEIGLSLATAGGIGEEIAALAPQAIHIATEGPIGWAARRFCLQRRLPFTTSFHTRYAEYAEARLPWPGVARAAWSILRKFHRPSRAVMAPTASIAKELDARGFANVKTWSRGVDHALFKPWPGDHLDLPRPVMLFSGRLAPEKNVERFLELDLPGTKVLVGDGPDRQALADRYPEAVFLGYRHGEDYARTIAAADVFVFPSLTDTFGLVMLEAMACGTPVAAFNVPSPIDVVAPGVSGELDRDLAKAVERALKLDRGKVHQAAQTFTWVHTAQLFVSWLVPFDHDWRKVPAELAQPLIHLR
jgi:glycosyltransferase involved in cell wall biosynthesis